MGGFSKEFIFGTATASYQIEGAAFEDGRAPSIWDTFSKTPGKTYMGHTGDVACDHYHRYKEDIKILKILGISSYRFSIAWPRIFNQKGRYNPEGMEFYKNLLKELKDNGIIPMVTLYHWDLPQWAQDLGGWANRECVEWFEEYCNKVFDEIGHKVKMWITHNEPFCSSFLGHYIGVHAPGHMDLKEALTAAHHILLSHGRVVKLFRERGFTESQIGITLNLTPSYAFSKSDEDIKAAKIADGFDNRWFLDPVFKGQYPKDIVELYEKLIGKLDFIEDGDLETISQQIDFLGVNYYTRHIVKYCPDAELGYCSVDGGRPKTEMGWEICPESLYDLLLRLKREYTNLPIYITENGAAFDDKVENGKVHDIQRIEYLRAHFNSALRFIEQGGNLKGYYIWSLMDNFEWALGYSKRFGIVYVDYDTQERIIKDSALWYKKLIETRSLDE
jgi:beta-glucosidase